MFGKHAALQHQVVIQYGADRERRTGGQHHAGVGRDHVTAGEVPAWQQAPAVHVLLDLWRRREAVVDAAVDLQVPTGTDDQIAHFPEP